MTFKSIVATAAIVTAASVSSTASADQFPTRDDIPAVATGAGGSFIAPGGFSAAALGPRELAAVRATGTHVGNGMPAGLPIFDTNVRNRITLKYNR